VGANAPCHPHSPCEGCHLSHAGRAEVPLANAGRGAFRLLARCSQDSDLPRDSFVLEFPSKLNTGLPIHPTRSSATRDLADWQERSFSLSSEDLSATYVAILAGYLWHRAAESGEAEEASKLPKATGPPSKENMAQPVTSSLPLNPEFCFTPGALRG